MVGLGVVVGVVGKLFCWGFMWVVGVEMVWGVG
jgi:hypothetical protein